MFRSIDESDVIGKNGGKYWGRRSVELVDHPTRYRARIEGVIAQVFSHETPACRVSNAGLANHSVPANQQSWVVRNAQSPGLKRRSTSGGGPRRGMAR